MIHDPEPKPSLLLAATVVAMIVNILLPTPIWVQAVVGAALLTALVVTVWKWWRAAEQAQDKREERENKE